MGGGVPPPLLWGKGRGGAGTRSVARKEAKRLLRSFHNRGLEEEARKLREEGEARSRRREAKIVRTDWKAKSIAKKLRESSFPNPRP
jgi:hypothetical protein